MATYAGTIYSIIAVIPTFNEGWSRIEKGIDDLVDGNVRTDQEGMRLAQNWQDRPGGEALKNIGFKSYLHFHDFEN